jgi:predicted lysophospholipase L1 biosynthesis ABC-type transport system permease subunit
VLAGREFQNEDVTDGAIVISRSMAARFWPNTNAVGRHLRLMLPAASTPWLPVVGVVEDVRQWINTPGEPTLYWASLRQPAYGVTIRTAAEPATLRSAVNRVVQQIDPDQPVFDVQTMQERLGHSQQLTYERFRTTVMGAFGVAALFLAGFGIYGVVRYAVVQRTQEFGIRMALGASPRQITAMIVLQSLRSVLIGGTIGLLGSLALGRLLRTMLYGAADSDPLLVGGVAFLLAALATVAAVGPARRAGSADPMRSLRAE